MSTAAVNSVVNVPEQNIDTHIEAPRRRPTVTLIFVTWNAADFIDKALKTVQAQTYPAEFIRTVVVDNASHDGTVDLIREKFPWVTLMPESVNHGFAVGNNIGMQAYPADYFALVNHDVELDPNWLTSIIDAMEADPTIGVAGSKIFYGNRILLQHTGGMLRENALTYHLGVNEFDIGQHETLQDVHYVMGAALVTRGELAKSLDYLHKEYFMYFEETDFCVHARKAGYRVVYVPNAIVYHDEKRSLGGRPTFRYLRLYHRSRYLFALRNMTTEEERQRFLTAEHVWRRDNIRGLKYAVVLLSSKLAHWRWLLKDPWLLR